MATPDDRKTLQVSADVHAAVHEMATAMSTSADGVLRHLFDKSTIRVHVADQQRQRWEAAAAKAGLPLPFWIAHRLEAFLEGTADRETLKQVFYRVDMLCRAAGITEAKPPRRTLKEK